MEDVVLTEEGDDTETLGVCKWSDLKGYVKMAFITPHKIPIAQAFRLTRNLGKNVANEINCSKYKQKIKGSRSKKKSATAKPDCIKVDGTLCRTVNVMIRNKEQVKIIKEAHNKDDADSRNPIWYSVC